MKTTSTLASSLSLAFVLANSATAQVKFGVGGPITGANAATGAQMKNGVDQAATDINAGGGILGQKIAVEYGDDVSDPKQGVSVANGFAGDGIKFVIGHYNSGVTIPASEVYQENGILEITPASTNPTVTERGMWNIFRTCGRDDQQGKVAGINFGDSTPAIALALLVPTLFAGLLGYFIFWGRVTDVYLGVITLTVTLILYKLFNATAGDAYHIGKAALGGFNGIPATPLMNLPWDRGTTLEPEDIWYVAATLLCLAYAFVRWLLSTKLGHL